MADKKKLLKNVTLVAMTSVNIEAAAELNKMSSIAKLLTPEYIDYIRAMNWDGRYPSTYLAESGETIDVINLN